MQQFCTFLIAQHLFGIAIKDVKEVSLTLPATPLAHAGPAIEGIVNLRGRIYVVLLPHALLGLNMPPISGETRLLLLRPASLESVALRVDRVQDIESICPNRLELRKVGHLSGKRPEERPTSPSAGLPLTTGLDMDRLLSHYVHLGQEVMTILNVRELSNWTTTKRLVN